MISAICTEFSRDEVIEFLETAIKRNKASQVQRPWATCFIATIKERLRENGETDRCKRIFGKTAQQKRKKDTNRRTRMKFEKRGIESVGQKESLKVALYEQISAIEKRK